MVTTLYKLNSSVPEVDSVSLGETEPLGVTVSYDTSHVYVNTYNSTDGARIFRYSTASLDSLSTFTHEDFDYDGTSYTTVGLDYGTYGNLYVCDPIHTDTGKNGVHKLSVDESGDLTYDGFISYSILNAGSTDVTAGLHVF